MIRQAVPVRFDRRTENGRTEPLRIAIETADGVEHDVVMKVSEGKECSIEGLANELLSSMLAADLGLPINETFLVRLDNEFIQSVAQLDIRSRLRASSEIAFASKHAGNQWRRWEKTDKIATSQVEKALCIFAFDGFTGNPDRSPRNSNMLVKDLDWRIIDHELAFGLRMKIAPRCEPWRLGNLELFRRGGEESQHIFAANLAKFDELNFDSVRLSWLDLSDARVALYDASLPEEWDIIRPIMDESITHIKQVRDSIDQCITELKRVLS